MGRKPNHFENSQRCNIAILVPASGDKQPPTHWSSAQLSLYTIRNCRFYKKAHISRNNGLRSWGNSQTIRYLLFANVCINKNHRKMMKTAVLLPLHYAISGIDQGQGFPSPYTMFTHKV